LRLAQHQPQQGASQRRARHPLRQSKGMRIIPEFQIGLLNGWIPFVLYFIGLLVSVSRYSKESRIWLFNNPKDEKKRVFMFVRLFGQLAAMAYILMMVITPINITKPIFFGGAAVYSIGYILEMSALFYFRRPPVSQPVVKGPYRFSRNPQWLGLFLVLLGSAIAAGVWLYVGIVVMVGIIYHIQILDEEKACITKYGERYREYMDRIPRYFPFL
jgi:protein-S-isoprenylcysteine O-methyltransferase Ste14